MGKQRVTLTIDADVYLAAKADRSNLSELTSKLLRQFFITNATNQDESIILTQLQKHQRIIEESQEEVSKLSVMLVQIREAQEKQAKVKDAQQDAMYKAMRESGAAELIFDD